VDAGHVLDRAIVGQRADVDAHLAQRLARVGQQALLEVGIDPGLGTTLAPSAGERLSIRSTCAAISCAVSTPFSISSERTASSSSS
jgi:saccharopine dehydrogenase-like NADP-dependent oxidoreductase